MSHDRPSGLRRGLVPERRIRRTLLGAAAAAALLLAPFAAPANASWVEPDPNDPAPVASENADVVTTGLGPGQRVQAFVADNPTDPDPLAPYPEGNPTGVPVTGRFAALINTADADGRIGQMYCINTSISTMVGIGYINGEWSEANVPNIGFVNYVLNNYYPANPAAPAGLTANQQAAAVQGAIWYFTDGYLVNTSETVIRPAVEAIVADAQENGPLLEPPPPSVTVTPPVAAAPVGSPAGPFTVAGEGSAGAVEVTVSVPTGFTMFADAAGTTPIPNESAVASGTQIWVAGPPGSTDAGVLTARAAVTVQTGNVYLYDGGNPGMDDAQPLILAATVDLTATAQGTAEFFVAGDLTVNKAFAGEGAGLQGDISLVVDCGASGVFTFEIPAGTTETVTETVAGLPVGTVCSVTEPVNGSTSEVTVTPDLPEPVTITDGENVLAVSNTVVINRGGLLVTKTFAGPGAGLQGDISLVVDCGASGVFTFEIPGGTTETVTETVSDLPVGTVCSVTEPETGSTSEVTVTPVLPEPVSITEGENVLAVANTVELNPGSLLVTKTITGNGAGLQDDIVIHVQCGEGIVDELFVVAAGTTAGEYTQLYEGIPAGTLCDISELASGANQDVTVESGFTGAVTILPGATQATGVTNLYAPVPVNQRLPKTGAESTDLALIGAGIVAGGSMLVLATLRRRQS